MPLPEVPDDIHVPKAIPVSAEGLTPAFAAQLAGLATDGCGICRGSGVAGYKAHGLRAVICPCTFPKFEAAVRAEVKRQRDARQAALSARMGG